MTQIVGHSCYLTYHTNHLTQQATTHTHITIAAGGWLHSAAHVGGHWVSYGWSGKWAKKKGPMIWV